MSSTLSARGALASSARLASGALKYLYKGETPDTAYQSMIRLFCATGGASNDVLSKGLSLLHPPYRLKETTGVLGNLSPQEITRVTAELDQKGYFVFENALPTQLCDDLLRFALSQRCIQRAFGSNPSSEVPSYPRQVPKAVRYDFEEQQLINDMFVQRLMADPSIIAIAQNYLRCKPIIDVITMWWHTCYLKGPDKDAAQFWHFDMDRIKWLKFFIYLTDVGPENGPHSFVAGSHRRGGIPRELLNKGYARLTDEEVNAEYSSESIIEFCGSRGTVIVEDTRGLHKGKHVECGDRLVLQLQFSNSLFGSNYPSARFERIEDSKLAEMLKRYGRLYENYKTRA
jgi:hypothetical protein